MRTKDAELIDRVPQSLRALSGIPEPDQARDRERAAALAFAALADLLLPGGVRTSPLGPGWSRDIDLYLRAWPKPARLEALGWIPLDPLLLRLGIRDRGKWAIMEDGRVLVALDLHLGPPPDPVISLLRRCRRRGEVRVREVLEARALLRAGHALPADDPVVRIAARVEAGLGGQELARWRDGPALAAPATLLSCRIRRHWAKMRSMLRPRVVIALSGVDGSGKSTLSRLLARNLDRADVPVSLIWSRPGTRLGWLNALARAGKKLLGQELSPGMVRVAGGASAEDLTSRRGVLGWMWAMLVTLMFLVNVRQQHVRSRGVLLYDRHLLDALATLEFFYRGVNLSLHRAVIRQGLPKAMLSIYLEVPAEVALARKPGDVFGEYVVRGQLQSYNAHRDEVEDLHRLDGKRPPDELAMVVTGWLVRPEEPTI